MFKNTLFVTTIIFSAIVLFVMDQCTFLIPYRSLLFLKYGWGIAAFSAMLFINLFAVVHAICRRVFLKDTGQKLVRMDNDLRNGSGFSEELSRRLREQG